MAVKRKPILSKAPARNAQHVKIQSLKNRLSGMLKGLPPKGNGDGWVTQPGVPTPGAPVYMDDGRGGLIEVPSNGDGEGWATQPGYASPGAPVYTDDGNGGLTEVPSNPIAPKNNPYASQVGDALRKFRDEQAVKFPHLPQKPNGPGGIQIDPRESGGFPAPMPGGFNPPGSGNPVPMPGGFNTPRSGFPAPMPGFNGGPSDLGGNGWKPPTQQPGAPTPGGGMISLDPREWGGNGGFTQQPFQPQKPNPLLGGGKTLPMPSPGRMPQPNPKRNLIPRPIDPRFKMM